MRRSDPSKSQITKLMPDASNISIAGGGGGGGNRLLPPTSPAMSNSSQSSGGSVASPLASPRGSIRRKLVVIGDGACGKTSLLLAYRNGRFSDSYVPTVFENSTVTVPVEDKLVELSLWDTAGQEDYDRLRPLSYPNSHVILVCCAVNNAESFANIYRKWQHELDQYCPGVPRIVVGCKTDLRLDSVDEHITTAQGQTMVDQIKAESYIECSAKTMSNVKEVFAQAARVSLTHQPSKKSRRKGKKPAANTPTIKSEHYQHKKRKCSIQ